MHIHQRYLNGLMIPKSQSINHYNIVKIGRRLTTQHNQMQEVREILGMYSV